MHSILDGWADMLVRTFIFLSFFLFFSFLSFPFLLFLSLFPPLSLIAVVRTSQRVWLSDAEIWVILPLLNFFWALSSLLFPADPYMGLHLYLLLELFF